MRRSAVLIFAAVALLTSGCSIYSWGSGTFGEIGDGTRLTRSIPTAVDRNNPNWIAVDAGDTYTCAIDLTRALYCWGAGTHGQLGIGPFVFIRTSPARVGTANDWLSVSAGGLYGSLLVEKQRLYQHTCGIRAPGTLHCWGNSVGLGMPSTSTPVQVGTASDWSAVSAGGFHTCGIRSGALYCWGDNSQGQVGDGTTVNRSAPVRIGAASDWTVVSASGTASTCGIQGGRLYCWGSNESGQLGDGSTTNRLAPTRVGTASDWTHVSTGGFGVFDPGSPELNSYAGHSCGIRAAGALYCWGENIRGQLGDGTTTARLVPTREGTNAAWRVVSAGGRYTCGIQTQGDLFCWGREELVPAFDRPDTRWPTRGELSNYVAVSAGPFHATSIRAADE